MYVCIYKWFEIVIERECIILTCKIKFGVYYINDLVWFYNFFLLSWIVDNYRYIHSYAKKQPKDKSLS